MEPTGAHGTRRVWVVILNWNGMVATRSCLNALASARSTDQIQVLVIDNGSRGSEAEVLAREFDWIDVVAMGENLGYAGGCNVGIRKALAAGADYVLLLNNDAEVEPTTITELVRHCDRHPGVGAAGPLITFAGTDQVWSAGSRLSIAAGSVIMIGKGTRAHRFDSGGAGSVEGLPGACLLLRSDVLREVGGLEEGYFAYWEDVDLCQRIRRARHELHLVPQARCSHEKSASSGASGNVRLPPLASYYIARNAFLFARLNLRGVERALFTITQLLTRAPIFLALKVAPDARVHYVRGVVDGLRGRRGAYEGWTKG